jgi:hypothetical protein
MRVTVSVWGCFGLRVRACRCMPKALWCAFKGMQYAQRWCCEVVPGSVACMDGGGRGVHALVRQWVRGRSYVGLGEGNEGGRVRGGACVGGDVYVGGGMCGGASEEDVEEHEA